MTAHGRENDDTPGRENDDTPGRENDDTPGRENDGTHGGTMNTTLVTSTEGRTGKTALALALALAARERGESVGYMKPKGVRLRSHVGKVLDEDPMLARELLDLDAEMHELEPVVYTPTFVEGAIRGQESPDLLSERVRERFDELSEDRDRMLIEGGGLTTGAVVGLTDQELADLLDADVLLVVPYAEPGDVDDVLVAADRIGDRLVGVIFNGVSDAAFARVETEVAPMLDGKGIPVLGVIPRDRELSGVTVGDLADELGAELLTDAPTDTYVERLLVGAMGRDAALRHFRRTKDAVVVTGGDRSDVQTVALESPGVKCLLLTGGLRPSAAVVGTAADRGVPVMMVRTDTLATIERAENIVAGGRTRDERSVRRMGELLEEHADIDGLLGEE